MQVIGENVEVCKKNVQVEKDLCKFKERTEKRITCDYKRIKTK